MRIHGYTVCVNYADLFETALPRWKNALDSLMVITTPADEVTQSLVKTAGASLHLTDVFSARGAHFNQAAGLNDGFQLNSKERGDGDWILFFDADVIPPNDIRARIEMCEPKIGHLYGANRHLEDGRRINDPYPAGFFLLFNTQDPNAKVTPIVETCWMHCGNWDTRFISRWTRDRLHFMPIPLRHIGNPGENWCGRGNTKAMNELLAERRRRRDWRHEKIQE